MERNGRWLFLLLAACTLPGAAGQSLKILPQTAAAGEWVAQEITFQPAAGREVVALQWDVEIPAATLDPGSSPVTRALLAVKEAGKFANCAAAKKTAETVILSCLLAGGQTPVPGGTVLLLSFRLSDRARPGMVSIRLQHAIAVTPNLKEVSLEPAEVTVTIRGR